MMPDPADTPENDLPAPAETKGRWYLVANLNKERAKASRPPGSGHSPLGAKVYVGDFGAFDWDRAQVLTKDRRSHRWHVTIIATHWLHNFRAVMEYNPSLQKRLNGEKFLGGYDDESTEVCRKYSLRGNQKALDWETERMVRRHAPPVEDTKK